MLNMLAESSGRDRIVVETNDNLQIKKISVSCTSPSIRIISYVPLDEEKEKRIPRAVEIIELVALHEFGDPGIGRWTKSFCNLWVILICYSKGGGFTNTAPCCGSYIRENGRFPMDALCRADCSVRGGISFQRSISDLSTSSLSSFTSDPTILGDHPSFVNTPAKDHNFDNYCMFTQSQLVFLCSGCEPHEILTFCRARRRYISTS